MKDIAFHLTDIVENSVRAGARTVVVGLRLAGREFRLRIGDDGCGMDAPTLQRALDPFYTTRTTRKVGLGLPFLIQNARQCGGDVLVRSRPGRGTTVEARFPLDHIDSPPAGDLAGTLMQLVVGSPQVALHLRELLAALLEEVFGEKLR